MAQGLGEHVPFSVHRPAHCVDSTIAHWVADVQQEPSGGHHCALQAAPWIQRPVQSARVVYAQVPAEEQQEPASAAQTSGVQVPVSSHVPLQAVTSVARAKALTACLPSRRWPSCIADGWHEHRR